MMAKAVMIEIVPGNKLIYERAMFEQKLLNLTQKGLDKFTAKIDLSGIFYLKL